MGIGWENGGSGGRGMDRGGDIRKGEAERGRGRGKGRGNAHVAPRLDR